jgi:hypothetical protein
MENQISNSSETPLERTIAYIENWLRTNEENQKAVQSLTDLLEVLKWEKDSISDMPESIKLLFDKDLFNDKIGTTEILLQEFAPPIPNVNTTGLTDLVSATTSATFAPILHVYKTPSHEAKKWIQRTIKSYEEIQKQNNAVSKTRDLIQKLQEKSAASPNLCEEYNIMIEKGLYYRTTELDKRMSAGIALRNVLEHYKGRLQQLAKYPTEQKTPSWEMMVERLSRYPKESPLYLQLLEEEKTYNRLHDNELTPLAKNNQDKDFEKRLVIETIVHLHTVLSLVKL